MSHQLPYFSLKQSVVARAKKAVLLPMKRSRAELISLRCHAALEALRRGNGWFGAAEAMTRVLLLAGFLSDGGYGRLDKEVMASAQRAIARVLDIGKQSGRWCLDDSTYRQFADVVNLHDRQLEVVPLLAYDAANGRLGRLFRALRNEQPEGCEVGAMGISRGGTQRA